MLNKEHFYVPIHAENVHEKLVPDPFFILINNPKQPFHARNYFKRKIFERELSKTLKLIVF